MKKYYLLLVCLLSLGNAYISLAQGAPQLQWVFNAVHTPSSNYQVSEGKSVATDAFGNVYVAGTFGGTADFDPSAGTANLTSSTGGPSQDIFLAKYDSSGNYLWAKVIGGTGYELITSFLIDNTGKLVIAGNFNGTADFDPSTAVANFTSSELTFYIAKYDSNGDYLSAKAMGVKALSFALSSSGAFYIAGNFYGNLDLDPSTNVAYVYSGNGETIFIAKYDANGNFIWGKTIVPTGEFSRTSNAQSLAVNSVGELYVAGYFNQLFDFDPSGAVANLPYAGSAHMDIFIAKYDNNGNYLWAKALGGEGDQWPESMSLNNSGEVYLKGRFQNTVDFNPSAATANLTSTDSEDIFFAKYDSNGNYLWAKALGGYSYSNNPITLNNNGDLYLTGSFSNTVDFDPSAAIANLTSTGSYDIFIAKYDSYGNYIWAKAAGGPDVDVSNSLVLNNNGEIYLTGYFKGTSDFDPSITCGSRISVGSQSFFLAKYGAGPFTNITTPTVTLTGNTLTVNDLASIYQWIDCNNGNSPVPNATSQSFTPAVPGNYAVVLTTDGCQSTSACQQVTLGVNEEEMASVKLNPNPTMGDFTISWADTMDDVEVVVTDLLGKTIKSMQFKGQQEARLSLDGAANGIYFVRLQSGEKTKQFKLIKK